MTLACAYAELLFAGRWERIDVPWATVDTARVVAAQQAAKRGAAAARVVPYYLAPTTPIPVDVAPAAPAAPAQTRAGAR